MESKSKELIIKVSSGEYKQGMEELKDERALRIEQNLRFEPGMQSLRQ